MNQPMHSGVESELADTRVRAGRHQGACSCNPGKNGGCCGWQKVRWMNQIWMETALVRRMGKYMFQAGRLNQSGVQRGRRWRSNGNARLVVKEASCGS